MLNRFYMAVHVINVRRALGLLLRELAEVIHLEEGQYANYDFAFVARNQRVEGGLQGDRTRIGSRGSISNSRCRGSSGCCFSIGFPRQTIRFNRRNIFARDGNQCQYCGRHFPTSELSLDHVVPRSRGGDTCWENIVCACVACNVKKGGRTPHEAHMKLIRPPVRPKRSPLLTVKLGNPKYESWKTFLDNAYWSVDLK